MFNSRRIEKLEKQIDSLFRSHSSLSERVWELKQQTVPPARPIKKRGRPVGSKSKKVATKKKQGIKLLSADEIYEKDALRGKKK